jgi:hypothetical protein
MGLEVEKDINLAIHVSEDETETMAEVMLDLRGDQFQAVGKARRNPIDPPSPLIGEELAIARALSQLQDQMLEAARVKIEQHRK